MPRLPVDLGEVRGKP